MDVQNLEMYDELLVPLMDQMGDQVNVKHRERYRELLDRMRNQVYVRSLERNAEYLFPMTI